MIEEIETVRAKQKARRNAGLGIASFVGSVLASAIIHLVNMQRAEADKETVVATAVAEKTTLQNQVAALRFELLEKFNALDKRVDHVETLLEERTREKKK